MKSLIARLKGGLKRRKGGPSHAISGLAEVIASLPHTNPLAPVSYAPATRTSVLVLPIVAKGA